LPFTLSHAAAVLPALRIDGRGRGPLVPSLLVAGSLAPDMTYYAASVVSGAMEFGDFTHSLAGVFTFDVVVAWALVGVWLVLREPLLALLPRRRQGRVAALVGSAVPGARLRERERPRPVTLLWWYVSAALGALTHVVWDAFTHLDRWGMRLFPVLGEEIAGSPLYWYLQYGGSAVAAVVIVVFVVCALRRQPPGRPEGPVGVPALSATDRWVAAAVIGGCALVGAVQRVARWWAYWGSSAKPYEVIPTLCFGAGAGLALGLVLYGAGVRIWRPAPTTDATEQAGEPVPR
jgi:hypothetical protein